MKFKYKDSDKVLIGIGSDVGTSGAGEVIEETVMTIPSDRIDFYERTALGVFSKRDQVVIDKIQAESDFSTYLMLGAMGLAFTGVDAVNLAPYLSAIQNYADFKNFKGIKDFIAGLVATGKATQAQATKLTEIFAQQGIDLGAY